MPTYLIKLIQQLNEIKQRYTQSYPQNLWTTKSHITQQNCRLKAVSYLQKKRLHQIFIQNPLKRHILFFQHPPVVAVVCATRHTLTLQPENHPELKLLGIRRAGATVDKLARTTYCSSTGFSDQKPGVRYHSAIACSHRSAVQHKCFTSGIMH